MSLCIAAAIAVLALPASAGARTAPSPKDAIVQATDVHNGAVKDMVLFARSAKKSIADCSQEDATQRQFAGMAIELEASRDLKPYNKRIPGWIDALDSVKPPVHRNQAMKATAITDLKAAHTTHEHEFYEFGAVGTAIASNDCSEAEGHLSAAAHDGDLGKAWIHEHDGLENARQVLGIKKPPLDDILVPYAKAGVGSA